MKKTNRSNRKDNKLIINGHVVDSYTYNEHERKYYFYNKYDMIICSIKSEKKTYKDILMSFGD